MRLIACLLATVLYAQSPAFEAAAIRLNANPGPQMTFGPELRNGRVTASNVTLKRMLAVAYGMTEPRVFGPGWLEKDHFDLAGTSPRGVPENQLKPMLQTLLQDRFKLTAHLETREMPVYFLVIAKGGVKMAVYPKPERPLEGPAYRGFPQLRGSGTTSDIADRMTFFVNQPVIDKTGLKERYNFFLTYAPLSPQGDNNPEFGPPDIFTAIQKQMGLKLEAGKDNVEVVVVDHMEQQPTEN